MTEPDQMPLYASSISVDDAVARLRESADHRVLTRVSPPEVELRLADPGDEEERRGLVLDVETTGRSHRTDAIIQFAAIPFRYTAGSGCVTAVEPAFQQLRDPGRSIPREVQQLTGISDQDVAGAVLDEDACNRMAEEADLIIAHNASFDRPFVEQLLPAYRTRPWACTWAQVPWGPGSQTLEMLLFRYRDRFIEAHRADEDCMAVIELLQADVKKRTALAHLVDATSRETVRVLATGAPFEVKDQLKERGYRWWSGNDQISKCWFRELPVEEQEREAAWLEAEIYPAGRSRAQFDVITAETRFRPMGS